MKLTVCGKRTFSHSELQSFIVSTDSAGRLVFLFPEGSCSCVFRELSVCHQEDLMGLMQTVMMSQRQNWNTIMSRLAKQLRCNCGLNGQWRWRKDGSWQEESGSSLWLNCCTVTDDNTQWSNRTQVVNSWNISHVSVWGSCQPACSLWKLTLLQL